ncbi:sigma-70 family RNA polymerase sigma factor [Paenibacillus abyssi]|uniref:RNA polymerase sigma factor SigS n=1 Tax=Paenibacillus abyssi TaxID=1340531 RepID=A0A917D247_9BACL|nr:sigma-70 family RNA polymerase sigma factor [Paenibacillus abyssi]GGG08468.1 RNA polymerase factor sigma-70 [Paenibacillus abyssi]
MTTIIETLTDEELVLRYMEGEQEAFNSLLAKYTPMIHYYCSRFFAGGMVKADLYQEGCTGLYIALMKFESDKGTFHAFARLHIRNHILNAVKLATRRKHYFLNHYISFFQRMEDSGAEEGMFMDFVSDAPTPEEAYLIKEETREHQLQLNQVVRNMSRIELQVFMEIMDGKSYKEAAEHISVSPKAVDNAISRIKKKALHIQAS